jgi:hypothetical protein
MMGNGPLVLSAPREAGASAIDTACSERFGLGAAQLVLELKQTAGQPQSQPACPVYARKQPWWWMTWDGRVWPGADRLTACRRRDPAERDGRGSRAEALRRRVTSGTGAAPSAPGVGSGGLRRPGSASPRRPPRFGACAQRRTDAGSTTLNHKSTPRNDTARRRSGLHSQFSSSFSVAGSATTSMHPTPNSQQSYVFTRSISMESPNS